MVSGNTVSLGFLTPTSMQVDFLCDRYPSSFYLNSKRIYVKDIPLKCYVKMLSEKQTGYVNVFTDNLIITMKNRRKISEYFKDL